MKPKMESLVMPAPNKNLFTEELPGNHNKKKIVPNENVDSANMLRLLVSYCLLVHS